MESRVEQAVLRHDKGYNCAQAVACTYCDLFGVDEDTMYRLAEGFGLGMGVMEVCGALTGAMMLAGLKNSAGVAQPGTTKGATYGFDRSLKDAFQEEAGCFLCRELKGVSSGTPRYSCANCIRLGARLTEKVICK